MQLEELIEFIRANITFRTVINFPDAVPPLRAYVCVGENEIYDSVSQRVAAYYLMDLIKQNEAQFSGFDFMVGAIWRTPEGNYDAGMFGYCFSKKDWREGPAVSSMIFKDKTLVPGKILPPDAAILSSMLQILRLERDYLGDRNTASLEAYIKNPPLFFDNQL